MDPIVLFALIVLVGLIVVGGPQPQPPRVIVIQSELDPPSSDGCFGLLLVPLLLIVLLVLLGALTPTPT